MDNLHKRALAEISKAVKNPKWSFFIDNEGVHGPKNDCYLKWTIPAGIYKDQTHILHISWVYKKKKEDKIKRYPIDPPFVRFYTPILHPNVFGADGICLDVLGGGFGHSEDFNKWSPMSGLESIVSSIELLLDNEEYYKCALDARIAQCNEHYKVCMTERYVDILNWKEFNDNKLEKGKEVKI